MARALGDYLVVSVASEEVLAHHKAGRRSSMPTKHKVMTHTGCPSFGFWVEWGRVMHAGGVRRAAWRWVGIMNWVVAQRPTH